MRRLTSDDEALSLTWRDGSKTTGRAGGGIAVHQILEVNNGLIGGVRLGFVKDGDVYDIYLFGLFQMVWFRE